MACRVLRTAEISPQDDQAELPDDLLVHRRFVSIPVTRNALTMARPPHLRRTIPIAPRPEDGSYVYFNLNK